MVNEDTESISRAASARADDESGTTSPPETEQTVPECVRCGYDLTGMRVEERCPECGGPVWPMFDRRFVQRAERPAWYRLGQIGFTVGAFALIMALFAWQSGVLGVGGLVPSLIGLWGASGDRNRYSSRWIVYAGLLASLLSIGVFAIGLV